MANFLSLFASYYFDMLEENLSLKVTVECVDVQDAVYEI